MAMENDEVTQKKLDTIIELLRNLLALELTKRGVSRGTIGKRLHIAKASVVRMLEGVKAEE
jgi:predicted transcriptional regulator